jgi:hypothetical protein
VGVSSAFVDGKPPGGNGGVKNVDPDISDSEGDLELLKSMMLLRTLITILFNVQLFSA